METARKLAPSASPAIWWTAFSACLNAASAAALLHGFLSYRPETAAPEESWVPMIPADANHGAEEDLWPIGRTGNVIRAMSLVPDEVRTLGDLGAVHYLPNVKVGDPEARPEHVDRPQTELVAARVSASNQCFY